MLRLPAIGIALAGLGGEIFQWNFLILGFATIASYVALFLLGFPVIHILRRIGWLTLPSVVLSGGVVGIYIFHLFLGFLGFLLGSTRLIRMVELLWGAVLGSGVALCFALIAGITNWTRQMP